MPSLGSTPAAAACHGAQCDFVNEYAIAQSPLMLEIEQRVRGTAYGATSWTTRTQAEATAARLSLTAEHRLLDLGSGSGWPALFLAQRSGCTVTATDLTLAGLRVARSRMISEDLSERCDLLAADSAALPFADGAFDRIHHADVLCCMTAKRELLRECRRVARPEALMEFSVVALTRAATSDEERELLAKSGPPHPDAGADYAVLLNDTGWDVLERLDVTAEFARCLDLLLQEFATRRSSLIALLGEADYAHRIDRLSTRTAVARGLMKREIFLARCR